jgi:hypothetical protein
MSDKKTVTVKALVDHTGFGKSHKAGDTYEIDADFLDSIVEQGKAASVDDVPEHAKAPKASHPVEPMETKKGHR